MSRKLPRLVLVASLATGFGLIPLAGADAANTRSVDAYADRFEVPGAPNPKRLDMNVGDTAAWNIKEGEHTVTPKDKWGDKEGSEKLTPESNRYEVLFEKPGLYKYYCDIHGDVGANNQLIGMSGEINVTDPNATPPPPPPPPASTTTTTAPPPPTTGPPTTQTTGTGGSSAGALTPTSTAPRPTTTNPPKPDKNKKAPKEKEEETTTTTTAPPPPAPVDIPDEAIIPSLPGSNTVSNTEVQEGAIGEALGETPEGDAIALLKRKRGGNGVKLLIASGIGLGVLGLGTAGYKFANRSSKYFPA